MSVQDGLTRKGRPGRAARVDGVLRLSKNKTRRTLGYALVALLIPFGIFIYYLADDLGVGRQRVKVKMIHDIAEPAPMVFEEESEPRPVQRRAVPITGRIFNADGGPLTGVQVRLGGETVPVDEAGRFRLAAALRPRAGTVGVVVRDGESEREILRFEGAVTGDLDPGSAQDGSGLLYAGYVPPRPQRIRWSIYVPRGAGSAAPPSSPRGADGYVILHDAILWEDWGLGGRAHFSGRTNLPDLANIFSSLKFDSYPVAAGLDAAVVAGGRWRGVVIVPPEVRTYSGEFEVGASFNSVLEDPDVVLSWSKLHPDIDYRELGEVVVTREVFLGEELDSSEEDRETESYFRGLLAQAHRFHDGLESRVTEVKTLGKGWDPSLLAARREALAGWFHESLIDDEGLLDVKEWRAFLDDRWRPALAGYLEQHRRRGTGKYREAFDRAEQLRGAILQMSRVYSLFVVYPQFGLPAHTNDFYFDERGENDLMLLRRVVDEQFESLERFTDLEVD